MSYTRMLLIENLIGLTASAKPPQRSLACPGSGSAAAGEEYYAPHNAFDATRTRIGVDTR